MLYSNADPWIALPPVRKTVLNCPPVPSPYSAENWFCNIENSATASLGMSTLWPVTSRRLLFTPSIVKLLLRGLCPPTEGPSPNPMAPALATPAPSSERFSTPRASDDPGESIASRGWNVDATWAVVVSITAAVSVTSTTVATSPTAEACATCVNYNIQVHTHIPQCGRIVETRVRYPHIIGSCGKVTDLVLALGARRWRTA